MKNELGRLDGVAQAALVARGDVSALELVDAALARIERVNPAINAITSLAADEARAAAKQAPRGVFGGVPILVKDLLSVKGQRFTLGARLFAQNVAQEEYPFVTRMREAGFILLGKTTTSELGMLGSTEGPLTGVTHNPYGVALSATGSSGGSAAAVASGMVPMAHASDGGGSIRLPASATGLFGFKPSRGRHVRAAQDDMGGLLSEHVVTRSVRDSALFLSVTEDHAAALPALGYVQGPDKKRLKIAVYTRTLPGEEPSADARAVLERTAGLCSELGHDVRWRDAPRVDGAALSRGFFALAGAAIAPLAQMFEPLLGRPLDERDLEPFTLRLIANARGASPDVLAEVQRAFRTASDAFATFLDDVDVTLCPTTPDVTPRLGELAPDRPYEQLIRRTERFAGYTPIHNIAGLPAMSVPLFVDGAGMPLGSHFAARRGADATLLALAYELEAARPWAERWPAIHAD